MNKHQHYILMASIWVFVITLGYLLNNKQGVIIGLLVMSSLTIVANLPRSTK